MGLSFGWKSHAVHESIWKDDDALDNVPESALSEWKVNGDAIHLRPYATKGEPSKITFRTLTADEYLTVTTRYYETSGNLESLARMALLCFRMAVDFPDAPTEWVDARGVKHRRTEKVSGAMMLSDEFIQHIEEKYPGISFFYGHMVLDSAMPTPAEKKASSPPSTPPPSEPPTAQPPREPAA